MLKKVLIIYFFIITLTLSINTSFSQEKNTTQNNPSTQQQTATTKDGSVKNESDKDKKLPTIFKGEGIRVGDIYKACRKYFVHTFTTKENVARKATCNGYFFGVGGTLLTLKMHEVDTKLCLPGDISTEQIIKDFLVWTKANLDQLELLATEGTLIALAQKYTCS